MRSARKTRGYAPFNALRRAVTLPRITPEKGKSWII